jgi:hypothetical protein
VFTLDDPIFRLKGKGASLKLSSWENLQFSVFNLQQMSIEILKIQWKLRIGNW